MTVGTLLFSLTLFELESGSAFAQAPPPMVQIRIGREGRGHDFEHRVAFEGAIGDEVVVPLEIEGSAYTVSLRSQPAGPYSSYEKDWVVALYRGATPTGAPLGQTFEKDPRETGVLGACAILTDYAATGGLWMEIGLDGSEYTAEAFCAANSPVRTLAASGGLVGMSGGGLFGDGFGEDDAGMIGSSLDMGELGARFGDLDDPAGGSVGVAGAGTTPPVSKPSVQDGVRAPKDRSRIASVVARGRHHLQGCYEAVLRDTPSVTGELEISFTLSKGAISTWQVKTNTTESDELVGCVERRMRGWRFRADDGPASWHFQFE